MANATSGITAADAAGGGITAVDADRGGITAAAATAGGITAAIVDGAGRASVAADRGTTADEAGAGILPADVAAGGRATQKAPSGLPAPGAIGGGGSVVAAEAAHFGALAADWWDPKGASAMLHRLNPVRLRWLRDRVDAHWGGDPRARRPLAGRTALDVGCGAGLLTEPLARLGATATGLDAAPENAAVAAAHAAAQGLAITYRAGGIEALAGERFDLVVSMEVIEHVADPRAFVAGLAAALAPGGLLLLSTPNRTALSRLALITLGEGLGQVPRGTHDWAKFLTPDELSALVADAGLVVDRVDGLALDPRRGFVIAEDRSLDYLLAARHG